VKRNLGFVDPSWLRSPLFVFMYSYILSLAVFLASCISVVGGVTLPMYICATL